MNSLGPLAAFLSSCTWALGSTVYSRISLEYSPFAVSFNRALIAFPLFVIAAFLITGFAGFEAITGHHLIWLSVSMIASYALGDACFFLSTRSLGVPGGLAIASSFPIWTTLAGVIFRGDMVTGRQWAGLLLTVSGLVLVILFVPGAKVPKETEGALSDSRLSRRWVGVILALAASLFWALNGYAIAQAGSELSAWVVNAVRMLVGIGVTALFCRLMSPGKPLFFPARIWKKSGWAIGIEAFGGSFFFAYGLANSPLVLAAILCALAPVISVPFVWLLGLERVSIPRTLGVACTVFGLWLLVVPI